jgi:ribosome-associated heat shock protein Hsp15
VSKKAAPAAPHADGARIDKWLWGARFYRTRSVATAAVDAGRVRVNDLPVKPARPLRLDDRLTIRIGGLEREVIVRSLDDVRMTAAVSQTRYAETESSLAARAAAEARRRLEREPAHSRKGRPTKRDLRDLKAFVDRRRDDDGF